MYCTNCGKPLEEDARFCAECGTPVFGEVVVQPTQPMPLKQPVQIAPTQGGVRQEAPTPPVQPVTTAQSQATTGKPTSAKASPALIAIAAVLAIALIAALVMLATGNKAPAPQENEVPSSSSEASSQEEQSSSASVVASNTSSEKKTETSSAPKQDTAKLEQQARDAAIAAGKQVLEGTIRMTTYGERAHEMMPGHERDFQSQANTPLALLLLDSEQQVEAVAIGSGGALQTRAASVLGLVDAQRWAAYDGQRVTIAAYSSDMTFPSDVTGVLYSPGVNAAELIAPLSGETTSAATQTSGDYVLPESNSRHYSRSELEALDNEALYHARNEIYARHGRQFKNADLQSFFNSKPWYRGTIAPGDFSESVLNEFERANASLILEIEQSRKSPYLN